MYLYTPIHMNEHLSFLETGLSILSPYLGNIKKIRTQSAPSLILCGFMKVMIEFYIELFYYKMKIIKVKHLCKNYINVHFW